MDRETFFMGKTYCSTHLVCRDCPIRDRCDGAFEMLPAAFRYIHDLEVENAKLRKRGNNG